MLFPIVTGRVVAGLSDGLVGRPEPYTDNVLVQPKLPVASQRRKRMVTVRDDSGPDDGALKRHRFGFNVWAESSVNAEKLALMCMAIVRTLPDGQPITSVTDLSGPFEVLDDSTDILSVDGVTLHHFYFSGVVSVRGMNL